MEDLIRRFPLGEPGKFLSELLRGAADCEALPDLSSVLESSPPPGGLADVGTEIRRLGDVWIVDGDEHDTLACPGVHYQLPEILRHRDVVLSQPDFLVVNLGVWWCRCRCTLYLTGDLPSSRPPPPSPPGR